MTENPDALPHDDVDPGGLLEYSVVFTDRSLNHMSQRFIGVMQEITDVLLGTYDAVGAAIVPGGGTYAMEAVARQIAQGRRCLVVRNGLFSYRWSQILEAGAIADAVTVCAAAPIANEDRASWAPAPVDEIVTTIRRERPEVVFAPHVETAAGIQLPSATISAIADAVHEVGGLFVLDCIASGTQWVSMDALGVDVLISAPQKGWSGSPCAGYVMLGPAGRAAVESTTSSSFAVDLRKWLFIADEYREGRAPYHATMPTDALARNAALMREAVDLGLEGLREAQAELGARVRALLAERGFPSVAAPGFEAPSVVVVHTDDAALQSGAALRRAGVQIAAGVPLHCGEPDDFSTFRIGLFGLDKLDDIDGTVDRLRTALDALSR